jgi:hypothetical protein
LPIRANYDTFGFRDEAAIRATAQEQAKALSRRVAADPLHRGMALNKAMAADQL